MRNPLFRSVILGLMLFAAADLLAADKPSATGKLAPADAARLVDQVLAKEIAKDAEPPAVPRISDEGFMRRVSLDLVGRVPSADEVTLFVLDASADKRARFVRDLLASEEFGKNWGRYW